MSESREWSDEEWQLDQAVMDAEEVRPSSQVARLRAIREEWPKLRAAVAALTAETEQLRSRANDSSRKPTKSTYSREVGVSNGQGGVSMLTGACSEAHARAYGLLREQPE